MSIITLYLIVLIIALVIGNLLLSVTKNIALPKQALQKFSSKTMQKVNSKALKTFTKEIQNINNFLSLLQNKISYLEETVSSLEETLEETKRGYSKKELEEVIKKIGEKLHKLEVFKSNTEVEMQAIKEIALEMRKKIRNTEDMDVIITQLKDLTDSRKKVEDNIKKLENKLLELYNEKANKLANHKINYNPDASTLEKDLEKFKKISLRKKGLIE